MRKEVGFLGYVILADCVVLASSHDLFTKLRGEHKKVGGYVHPMLGFGHGSSPIASRLST